MQRRGDHPVHIAGRLRFLEKNCANEIRYRFLTVGQNLVDKLDIALRRRRCEPAKIIVHEDESGQIFCAELIDVRYNLRNRHGPPDEYNRSKMKLVNQGFDVAGSRRWIKPVACYGEFTLRAWIHGHNAISR